MTGHPQEPDRSGDAPGAGRRPTRVLVAVAVLAVVAAAVAMLATRIDLSDGGSNLDTRAIAAAGAGQGQDPFAYSTDRESEFESRAAAGLAHVLYAKSPDG